MEHSGGDHKASSRLRARDSMQAGGFFFGQAFICHIPPTRSFATYDPRLLTYLGYFSTGNPKHSTNAMTPFSVLLEPYNLYFRGAAFWFWKSSRRRPHGAHQLRLNTGRGTTRASVSLALAILPVRLSYGRILPLSPMSTTSFSPPPCPSLFSAELPTDSLLAPVVRHPPAPLRPDELPTNRVLDPALRHPRFPPSPPSLALYSFCPGFDQ